MSNWRIGTRVMFTLGAALLLSNGAFAAKPPPVPVDTGLVYFETSVSQTRILQTMAPDGSAKHPVWTVTNQVSGARLAASRDLHGGRRWFLHCRLISGSTYPGTSTTRREWFAVRDDGIVVTQLTWDTNMIPYGPACWSPGDASVSFGARRWLGSAWGVAEIFVAPVLFDGNGDVTGLDYPPTAPTVALPTFVESHDWSPDGTRIVVVGGSNIMWIANLSSGALTRLGTSVVGGQVSWSPDGSRIAFSQNGDISTIAPDGSGLATIVGVGDSSLYYYPQWSPHGTHVLCQRTVSAGSVTSRVDVYRFQANGGYPTNLTADLDTRPTPYGGSGNTSPVAWR